MILELSCLHGGNIVEPTPDPFVWEIWPIDHQVPLSHNSEILIGRSDPVQGIIVDLDPSTYLIENYAKAGPAQEKH